MTFFFTELQKSGQGTNSRHYWLQSKYHFTNMIVWFVGIYYLHNIGFCRYHWFMTWQTLIQEAFLGSFNLREVIFFFLEEGVQAQYPGEGCLRFNFIFGMCRICLYVKSKISRGGGLDLIDPPPPLPCQMPSRSDNKIFHFIRLLFISTYIYKYL